MSVEDIAQKVCVEYGKRASYDEMYEVLAANGFPNPTSELVDRIAELVDGAVIRVRVRLG